MLENWNQDQCRKEISDLLGKIGLSANLNIEDNLDHDYIIECRDGAVDVRAKRLRCAFNALGDIEQCVNSGRKIIGKKALSPFPLRLIEAWAPMHSHLFLPIPEYHEHSWHARLREPTPGYVNSTDIVQSEVEMAIIRFERFVRLAVKQGYTHIVLDDQDYLVLFDKHPEIYPADSHFRKRHSDYRALFRRLIDICSSYDMKFVLYCQEFGYTPPMKEYIGELGPDNPKLWELFEEKYDEIIDCFPEMDGFLFKMSDSFVDRDGWYSHSDFYKQAIRNGVAAEDAIQILKQFVNKAYNTIVKKHGRKFMYRTWDVNHGIHVNVKKHRELFAGIDDKYVYVLLKHTKGDFQLSNPPHPGIGGMTNQIVEYQFKLEHDGHGTLPLYVGGIFEKSLKVCAEKGVKGIWAWPMGGGQSSIHNIAYFKGFTRFIEVNQFVFSNLMMDPSKPHGESQETWGDIVIGPGNGKALHQVFNIAFKAMNLIANFGDLWTGKRDYAVTKFHHGWFFEWQQFCLVGKGSPEAREAGNIVKKDVLPYISDIEKVIERMHEAAGYFKEAYDEYEKNIRIVPGYEHDCLAMKHQFKAGEAFGELVAVWVEALLRYYSGKYSGKQLAGLLEILEERKNVYDRNYGVFVTQNIDFFLDLARNGLKAGIGNNFKQNMRNIRKKQKEACRQKQRF